MSCPGSFRLGNRVFRCWKEKGHGTVDMYRAVVQSCDVFFYTLGLRLGFRLGALGCFAFGVGSTVLLSWFAIGRCLRPVSRLSAEASDITPSSMGRRLTVPPEGAELTGLVRAFNQAGKPIAAVCHGAQLLAAAGAGSSGGGAATWDRTGAACSGSAWPR